MLSPGDSAGLMSFRYGETLYDDHHHLNEMMLYHMRVMAHAGTILARTLSFFKQKIRRVGPATSRVVQPLPAQLVDL